jgi:hypothetical protein
VVKFASYPKGVDGLYGSDFVRYGYVICESISFDTAHGRIRGSREAGTGFITNDADSIFVEGNTVKLFVSGVTVRRPRGVTSYAAYTGFMRDFGPRVRLRASGTVRRRNVHWPTDDRAARRRASRPHFRLHHPADTAGA